ncbi:hypothetical protein ACF0H5_010692 [Mactra antiquata]
MAAEVKARQNKNSTIAFTLPISCQVCLGKVKNPVLCPNQHVFCGPCMDVWLQKNKQCPACRTSMTSGKKIIGGLSQQEDDKDKLTNPDLRKARFDLLYKEYENEFERMSSEIQLLKTENQILKQQRKKDVQPSGRSNSESSKAADTTHLLALTKKLQDATKQYEKIKDELSRLKQENVNLKDENLSLNRENQHLRQELAGRSPQRYGRITVSTLESKLASAEKDVTRLTKALERSDKYIEELESELEEYRGKQPSSKRPSSGLDDKYLVNGDSRKYSSDSKILPSSRESGIGQDMSSRRQLFSDDSDMKLTSGEHSKHYYEQNGDYRDDYRSSTGRYQTSKNNGMTNGKKRVTFDLDKNTNTTTSFDLELPSPLKTSANASGLTNGRASPVKGVLKKSNGSGGSKGSSSDNKVNDKSGYSTDLSKDSLSDSYNLRPTENFSKDDDLLYLKSRSSSSGYRDAEDNAYSKNRKKYSADDSILSEPSEFNSHGSRDYVSKSRSSDYDRNKRSDLDDLDLEPISRNRGDTRDIRNELDDTLHIESELDELNISLTPEFTDCMKILNRAEKNVHKTVPDVTDNLDKYRSMDNDMDTAFRASTGSIGTKSSYGDDLASKYKSDNSKFSSFDSFSRGRHVRSGSLDNLFIEKPADQIERPSSALGGAVGNMYPPTSQSKYMSGLTTGRTSLTRTPSLDNLLITRPSSGSQNKYGWLDGGYSSRRTYGEENKAQDLNAVSGSGVVGNSAPVPAKHDILSSQGFDNRDLYSIKGFDKPKDTGSHIPDYTSGTYSVPSSSTNYDNYTKMPPSGRLTPTLPTSSTVGGGGNDKQYSSGRVTPTIPTHSEYMALSKPSSDKYSYSSALTSNPRSTPTLPSEYAAAPKSSTQFSSGPSSLPSDLSRKPPMGYRPQDSGSQSQRPSYASLPPTYKTSSGFTDTNTNTNTDDYYSLPTYTANTGDGLTQRDQSDMKYSVTASRNTDAVTDKFDYIPTSNYKSSTDDRFNNVNVNSKSAVYNDNNYKDGTDFSNYSTKVGVNNNYMYSSSSLPSSVSQPNLMSASSTGPSSSSSMGLGLSSYPGPSSYIPPSSLTSSTSYSTALSVPLTSTTSAYTSSLPASNYSTKPLDPIAESGHYSYVSNVSGDYSSKNDTFALPEPKKRLFENSDDLDMSVSPIKSNRRF